MSTQPVPGMPNFNARVEEFRIWQPETYERNLRGATMGTADDTYLFLICAFDYVFNPADIKMIPLNQLFMTPDNRRPFATDTYWTLNISPETMQSAAALFAGAPLQGMENPVRQAGLGNGQGVANYNLMTKLIEYCCRDLNYHSHVKSVADMIKTYRDRALSAAARNTLVSRYNTLRNYYADQALTKFGLVYR